MISPHTPSGTKVVCIARHTQANIPSLPSAQVGEVYTVVEVVRDDWFYTGFGVALAEMSGLFGLNLFRRLDLPDSLTSLLNTQKSDLEAVQ